MNHLSAAMASEQPQQPLPVHLALPTKADPGVAAVVAQCADLFVKFVRCSRRSITSGKDAPDYRDLMAASERASAAGARGDAAKLKRRADNVLIMAMMRECGYVRTPLKDCIAEHACTDARAARDRYLASRPDLNVESMHAVTQPKVPGEAVRGMASPQQRAFAEVSELEKGITDCVRRYQFAMNVSWDKASETFDLDRLDNVQIEVVRPGQM
ncbi:hypothetical protein H9P43_004693 [Blastocladiella emersonii ATCC 22665]|nr:hypothetical protein H9P43_004693 [Blastocladiella emersonii ATCC 22665]